MDRQEYMAWLSEIDELSADQRAEAGRALAEQPSLEAVVCLLEERIGAERRCPHCAAEGAVMRLATPTALRAGKFPPTLRL